MNATLLHTTCNQPGFSWPGNTIRKSRSLTEYISASAEPLLHTRGHSTRLDLYICTYSRTVTSSMIALVPYDQGIDILCEQFVGA